MPLFFLHLFAKRSACVAGLIASAILSNYQANPECVSLMPFHYTMSLATVNDNELRVNVVEAPPT